jgi:hypothetical protein
MPDEYLLDEDAARRLRDEFLSDALPVRFAGPVSFVAAGEEWPVVQVDAHSRPDVADLARVDQSEGLQRGRRPPMRYLFVDGQGYMEFVVEITDPVACQFKFVLQWPVHETVFTAMLSRGVLVFTVGALEDALADGIGMRINQTELGQVLTTWRTLREP